MERVYRFGENLLYDNIDRNTVAYGLEKNRKVAMMNDKNRFVKKIYYNLPVDVMLQKYKLHEVGKLRYTKDESVKSEPMMLNEYGDPYERGRNTLLQDTLNRYPISVSSYKVKNESVPLKYSSRSVGYLLVK
jgi:hypothetical protein